MLFTDFNSSDFSPGCTFWLFLSRSCWLPFIIDRCFWLSLSRCCSLPFINYHQQVLWQLCQAVRFSHRSWSGHRLFLNPDLYIVFSVITYICQTNFALRCEIAKGFQCEFDFYQPFQPIRRGSNPGICELRMRTLWWLFLLIFPSTNCKERFFFCFQKELVAFGGQYGLTLQNVCKKKWDRQKERCRRIIWDPKVINSIISTLVLMMTLFGARVIGQRSTPACLQHHWQVQAPT